MKRTFARNLGKFFLVTLSLFIVAANFLVLFPTSAQAIPPKNDWVWVVDQVFHCEAAQQDHCLPASAYSY